MPKLPNIFTQGKNALIAYAKWVASGKPPRPAERIEELFDICAECPVKQFIPVKEGVGRCASCGCWLRRFGTKVNKLAVPTESCPHDVWPADVEPLEE